jgi:hypothetical protein
MTWPEENDPETSAIYTLNDVDVKAPPQPAPPDGAADLPVA